MARPITRSAAMLPEDSSWWTWELAGLMTIGVGVVLLAQPGNSLEALTVIAGVYLVLDGILAFMSLLAKDTENRELPAIHGVVSLVVGLVLIRHPLEGITAVAILIGLWLVTAGCVRTVGALRSREHVGWRLLVGFVQLVAGIVIIAQPHIGYNTLALVAGISFVFQGLALMGLGWSLRGGEKPAPAPLRPGPAAR